MTRIRLGRPDLPPSEPDLPVPGDPLGPDTYPDPMPDPQPVPPQDPQVPPPGRINPPVRGRRARSARLRGHARCLATPCDDLIKLAGQLEDLLGNRLCLQVVEHAPDRCGNFCLTLRFGPGILRHGSLRLSGWRLRH